MSALGLHSSLFDDISPKHLTWSFYNMNSKLRITTTLALLTLGLTFAACSESKSTGKDSSISDSSQLSDQSTNQDASTNDDTQIGSDTTSDSDSTNEDSTNEDATPGDTGPDIVTVSSIGCASGKRAGFIDETKFPAIAACAGSWTGDVSNAASLCASGWHVCMGNDSAVTNTLYNDAIAFTGCFAFDAAQDNYACLTDCSKAVLDGVDTAENIDMAGVGSGCLWKYPSTGSCISGGRIDSSENSGTGCDYHDGLTGVVCCKN